MIYCKDCKNYKRYVNIRYNMPPHPTTGKIVERSSTIIDGQTCGRWCCSLDVVEKSTPNTSYKFDENSNRNKNNNCKDYKEKLLIKILKLVIR